MKDLKIITKAFDSGNAAAISAAMKGDMENARIASQPGGIEAQEKAGQTTLVAMNDRLPITIGGYRGEALDMVRGRLATEWGIEWGQHADELFIFCKLPEGWKLRASEHSMHSDLLDDKGCSRASVFYKAAFYDRRADMRLHQRYTSIWTYGEGDYETRTRTTVVKDNQTGEVLWTGQTVQAKDYAAGDIEDQRAEAWMKERFPQNRDPLAYWE